MTFGEAAQILTALVALGTLLLTWSTRQKVESVHKATNSMKDELVKEVRDAAHAAGLKEGREERND